MVTMRTIYNKYDKNKINTLPQELFSGKIVEIGRAHV